MGENDELQDDEIKWEHNCVPFEIIWRDKKDLHGLTKTRVTESNDIGENKTFTVEIE